MTATTAAPPAVLPAWDVRALPWEQVGSGIRARTLWESPASRAIVLLIESGAELPLHVHPDEEHHAYVVEGRCAAGGRPLAAGSYSHATAGEQHDVRGEGPYGATILYVFERGVR